MNLEHVDRGSMHVVEHHKDLFSWKKYNSYMFADNILYDKEIQKRK
jgi:hypothetical protein